MNSQELFRQYRSGDSQAAAAIFDRYVARLVELVRSRMGARLNRRVDPDDVVQSAYRSFFVRAADDRFQLDEPGDLWRLLATIALNKLYGQVEQHTAARRNVQCEQDLQSWSQAGVVEPPEPTPEEIASLDEQLEFVALELDEESRQIIAASLRGESLETIATALGKSPRTVRRIRAAVQHALERKLLPLRDDSSFRAEALIAKQTASMAFLDYADFTLERLLGVGGMGKVYRATQRSTGQTVALKSLHKSRQADSRAVAKFLEEAQILAQLDHPGIVHTRGVGRFPGGGFFLVIEIVEGGDLQARLTRGPLNVAETVRIVHAAATAVAYSHERGIVHGDLKPGNLLMANNGRVVVSDFGLAQFLTVETMRAPRRWIVGGTEGYLAPEVRRGESPMPAADIYGLGALTWALVTGRPPGCGADLPVDDRMPEALARICARCLAAEPRRRYASARECARALDELSLSGAEGVA